MTRIDPSLVRTDRLRSLPKPGAAEGVAGDPTRSSAEIGAHGVELIVNRTAAAIRTAVASR